MKHSRLIFSLTILLLISCSPFSSSDLSGKWQAYNVTEENKPLEVEFNQIQFEFDENGDYSYVSTLNYKESGNYYLKKDLLYTTDTLNENAEQKAVQIMSLNADSLILKMNESGKERIMKLKKI